MKFDRASLGLIIALKDYIVLYLVLLRPRVRQVYRPFVFKLGYISRMPTHNHEGLVKFDPRLY
jgi:hypothetical protein